VKAEIDDFLSHKHWFSYGELEEFVVRISNDIRSRASSEERELEHYLNERLVRALNL